MISATGFLFLLLSLILHAISCGIMGYGGSYTNARIPSKLACVSLVAAIAFTITGEIL